MVIASAGDAASPTIVLIHGYPDSHTVWSSLMPLLASRFHVVAYDVRGAGPGPHPRGLEAYDLDCLVSDFLDVASRFSPSRPVHVVGHDWGSMQGWEIASVARTTGRVASFTSVSGPSLDHAAAWLRSAPLRARLRQAVKAWHVGAFQLPGASVLARLVVPRVVPSRSSDAGVGVRLYRRNIRRRLRAPRDAAAHVPVQLVVAARDPFVSPGLFDGIERFAPVLRRRTLVAGHWVQRTHPAALASLIDSFVSDVEAGLPVDLPVRRVVLVTGAGSGIGRATALAFAADGADVVAVDIDGDAAARTAVLCQTLGGVASSFAVDVTDPAAMSALADSVGAVDVLVNNAGIGVAGPFLDTSPADWERVLDVNLMGVVHGCRAFGRAMVARAQGGAIVNVASAAAFQPSRDLPAYSASKAAVLMLSECLAAELGDFGITMSAICPGIVNTNITRTTRFVGVDDAEEKRLQKRAARLYGLRGFPPERVADAIVRAARTGALVVPVTPEAKAAYWLSRFAPSVLRRIGRVGAAAR